MMNDSQWKTGKHTASGTDMREMDCN